ncbi:unnamed protein product [Rotaria socialis]|uniref:RRM domain-containing protein n=3 Tax=Rotaria TaxID=231623 RepID=A0A820U7S3_9BILA|nr:unnamed protein product [Rotaria socialis]
MSSDNENQKSPNRLRSHSRSRSPVRLSPSHNNQQKNNHYRSSYSNPNNTNDHRNTDYDQFNQTINLYSDRELGLKYRREKTIHVSNIPYDMTWIALKDLFRTEVGQVIYIEVFEQDGKSLGCGSVEFRTVEEAKHADEEGYQTRQAKYQTVEGRLSQKNNMLHHHYNLSNQFALFLHNVQSDILISVLIKLSSLPRLKSLTINMFDISIDLANIYQLVFKLSILTYYKLSIHATNLFISLPIATNQQQQSAIESLIIDHRCSFDELSAIISFTLQLRRLKLTHGFNHPLNKELIPSIMLENLTYLSSDIYGVEFDGFKTFIRKMNSKLKTLNVIIQCEDMMYLDAYQWKQLLLHYYPQLEKFYFTYYDRIDNNSHQYQIYSCGLNPFSTLFWIQRKWIFKAKTEGTSPVEENDQ